MKSIIFWDMTRHHIPEDDTLQNLIYFAVGILEVVKSEQLMLRVKRGEIGEH
jgi:hypothetical protein